MKCTHTHARARNRCKEYAYMAVAVIYVAFKVLACVCTVRRSGTS